METSVRAELADLNSPLGGQADSPHSLHRALRVSWRQWLLGSLALLLSLVMLSYGLVAIDTGVVNFKSAGNAEVAAKRAAMIRDAEAGRPVAATPELADHSGVGIYALGQVGSPTYAFGKRGLMEQLVYYAEMPKLNGQVISFHNMLGGACMLVGALQFWPALRKKFPRVHRSMGVFYLVTAQLAMVAAIIYLARTPVDKIYDQLTFCTGLWMLAIGVTVSLWMAMYSLWKKQIAQHQGWMALSYAMLLTAPIQRFGWAAFGAATSGLRQLEANYAVSDVLVPLCLMLGYGLFTVNRWIQAKRPASAQTVVSRHFARLQQVGPLLAWAGILALAASGWAVVQHVWLASAGLGDMGLAATGMVPAGVIQMYDRVIFALGSGRELFSVAYLGGVLSGIRLLWKSYLVGNEESPHLSGSAWTLAWCSSIVGAICLLWGWQMGLPSFATIEGGAIFIFAGVTTLTFAGLMAFAMKRKEVAWVKEWGVFAIACLIAIPGLCASLPVVAALGIDPAYVQTGHAYRLASIGPWVNVLLTAFVVAMYGQATHSRFAR